MLEKIIDSFVKSVGVSVILSKRVYRGVLDVFYYNWVGKDDRFYSLLAPCSMTMIYTAALSFTNCYSYVCALENNLRSFDTKAAWCEGKWSQDYAKGLSHAVEDELDRRSCCGVSVGQYRTEKIIFHLQPSLGVTVWYSDDRGLHVLTAWCGAVTEVYADDLAFYTFVEMLGIAKCVKVSVREEQLKIGINETVG